MKIFLKYWLPVILYAAAIFLFSSISKPPEALSFFPYADKVLHFIEYAVFGFLMIRALYSSSPGKKTLFLRIGAVIIVALYGFTDELHQYFVPERNMELLDIITDGLGAFAGQLFFRR